MDDSLKRDAARALAQRAAREHRLWVRPAGGIGEHVRPPQPATRRPRDERPDPAGAVERPRAAPAGGAAGLREREGDTPAGGDTGESFPRGAPEPEYGIPIAGQLEDPFPAYTDIAAFERAICNCRKCPLGHTRQKFVFGVGDPHADLVLIGEAPGAEEDRLGEPFVGRAGKLLDQILAAVDLKRGEGVYICNILKCRPPQNRDPLPSEVSECEPHLVKQLQLLEPKLIVALGRVAAQVLLRTSDSLSRMRGKLHDYRGVPLMVTYHPAALLRNPQWKRPTWEDVQMMKKTLDDARGG